jgi:hypothetical protein
MARFSRDTTEAAERFHAEVYRNMPPARRVAIAMEMSDSIRDIALAGIRARHPGLSEREAIARYVFESWGVALNA